MITFIAIILIIMGLASAMDRLDRLSAQNERLQDDINQLNESLRKQACDNLGPSQQHNE
jgi:sulfite exporter TauE/SafE